MAPGGRTPASPLQHRHPTHSRTHFPPSHFRGPPSPNRLLLPQPLIVDRKVNPNWLSTCLLPMASDQWVIIPEAIYQHGAGLARGLPGAGGCAVRWTLPCRASLSAAIPAWGSWPHTPHPAPLQLQPPKRRSRSMAGSSLVSFSFEDPGHVW